MNIKQYLPQFLQDVKELKYICETEDIELEKIEAKIDELLDEIIVNRAKGYGLERYEKIYNIIPSTNDLDERRFDILSKMNDKAPFTMKWLENKLKTLVGENNYSINIDYDEYSLTIGVSMLFDNIANTLSKSLREQLPANLLITVNLFQTESTNMYIGSVVRVGNNILIRSEVE